ncbi:hypothetical protein MLD38_002608 [Melastoma candidum]|uniref:Uncharacterized protein n=1 Tax=Melastoma candidum TaxID=119954 RepID=A0ACB9S4A7_9MYRT|nr:hypothetical protein MLD38_002608 [Melastoma candidum]
MATIPSSSTPLHLPTTLFLRRPRPQQPRHSSFSVKSSDTDTPPPEETSSSAPPPVDDGAFENRLSKIRLRYRSGTGKKAELRKAKKAGSAASSSSSSLYLPPVPLKEPKSFDGSKVEIGFSTYSEKINGRIAMLGLTALLLVELATGKGVINYHTPAIILIQVYFVAAVGAIWIKYEKESVAVWPKSE